MTSIGPARWAAAAGFVLAGWLLVVLLLVATVLGVRGAAPAGPYASFGASAFARGDIPRDYLQVYERAGADAGLDWALLAAIGKVETDHGRARLPGVRSGVNCAGAAGPMQLGIGAGDHGCGDAGNAWAAYGRDGNGDGRRDVYDPADAIPAAAAYLRAAGAPSDVRRAVFAYNHADWYLARVLAVAERYRGPATETTAGSARRRPFAGTWLSTLPGTRLQCDARIVDDVLSLMRNDGLSVTACFARSGHAIGGEHPLGPATDLVPADGRLGIGRCASRVRFGWSPACAASGCAGSARAPFRVVPTTATPATATRRTVERRRVPRICTSRGHTRRPLRSPPPRGFRRSAAVGEAQRAPALRRFLGLLGPDAVQGAQHALGGRVEHRNEVGAQCASQPRGSPGPDVGEALEFVSRAHATTVDTAGDAPAHAYGTCRLNVDASSYTRSGDSAPRLRARRATRSGDPTSTPCTVVDERQRSDCGRARHNAAQTGT